MRLPYPLSELDPLLQEGVCGSHSILCPPHSEDHPISARTLGAIEGLVGGLEYLLRVCSPIIAVGHTDADGHGHFLS